jgi:hypothetical protein
MNKKLTLRTIIAFAVLGTLAAVGVGYAAIPGGDGVIHGCYNASSNPSRGAAGNRRRGRGEVRGEREATGLRSARPARQPGPQGPQGATGARTRGPGYRFTTGTTALPAGTYFVVVEGSRVRSAQTNPGSENHRTLRRSTFQPAQVAQFSPGADTISFSWRLT